MDKKQLQDILSQPYQPQDWVKVLKDIFGVRNILQKPSPILLPSNKKAEAAFELGSFNTSDDRIIGLYLVKVKPEVWLERNKVGLRELLRSVYKYEVDGALIVFEQQDKWRLSFVSEIRSIDEDGSTTKKITEPKRYTYLLGKGEKTKTPVTRLSLIGGKTISLEDIRNAFSVEALNEEFYKIVARHFYQLIGATEGKGTKEITHDRVLKLPSLNHNSNGAAKIYQEFAVRLIGRTVFCWFLKVKKSEAGISLLPEHLLSSEAVKRNNNYYHFILEKLFFQTLNTPMDERIKELPLGCEQIPFLNGGLFEPQTDDYYKPNRKTGLSDNLNTLIIPDDWFRDFFENLEQYNFTIDENSVVDIEVSVDPEMLGRIFENLLAEIDPDSGETARKATGSFYTPREIVDYMATESLVHYLNNQTNIENESLHSIFKIDSEISFSKTETEGILEALDRLKILDPACGSGAFPMGVLQKIVMALQKLDKNAEWWKARQISRIENAVLRKQVKEKLQQTTVEYARKIGIIQNSLYGVDIQPIAAEISKLRCFLTLIVDENIDENKPNRGVEPLPNLEFKFVTADTLLKLPQEKDFGGLFNANDDLDELQQIRLDYLQSFGEHKAVLKEQFEKIRNKIARQQIGLGKNVDVNSRAYKISMWNPFSHEKVDWFDAIWMYGVKDFDIIIGNPPYGIVYDIDRKKMYESLYTSFKRNNDIYVAFYSCASNMLSEKGILTYITPNTFFNGDYFTELRTTITKAYLINEIIDFKNSKIFKDPTVFVGIVMLTKCSTNKFPYFYEFKISNDNFSKLTKNIVQINSASDKPLKPLNRLVQKIQLNPTTKFDDLFLIKDVGFNYWSIGKGKKRDGNSIGDRILYSGERETEWDKPYLKGRDIEKFGIKSPTNYLRYNFNDFLDEGIDVFRYSTEILETIPKIIYRQTSSSIVAAIDYSGCLVDKTVHVILHKEVGRRFDLKFILCLLNSSLFNYLYIDISQETEGRAFAQVKTTYIKKLPLINKPNLNQVPFMILADYCHFLKEQGDKKPINEFVPNRHIVQLFQEVIDALVYELYFEEDFRNAKISFMKYAERDFKGIERLGKDKKIIAVHKAYQTLKEKENEIRQNLKLMDTRLADLIMPIKTAK